MSLKSMTKVTCNKVIKIKIALIQVWTKKTSDHEPRYNLYGFEIAFAYSCFC